MESPKKKTKKKKPAERKCQRPSRGATAEELSAYRRGRLARRAERRERDHRELSGTIEAVANLGRKHPDHGMTPAEHAREKARRTAAAKAG